MVIKLNSGSKCNISFANNLSKFSNWSDKTLLVNWYKNGQFYDSIEIPSNRWGAIPVENIDVWRIDISGELSYINEIEKKDILINAKFETDFAIQNLERFCERAKNQYDCKIHVYIKNSHLLDLQSNNYRTLKLNQPIKHMALGLNKIF